MNSFEELPLIEQKETSKFPINLDSFFRNIYIYYENKGFDEYVLSYALTLYSKIFSTMIVLILFLHISKIPVIDNFLLFYFSFIVITGVLFIKELIRVNNTLFLYSKMNIGKNNIKTMNWSSIISRLVNLQNETHFILNGMKINALNVCARIMRIDNYKIAVYNHNILPFGTGKEFWYLGFILEKYIDLIIFNNIIDKETFELKRINNRDTFKRIKFYSILSFFLIPFSIILTILYFFFNYITETYLKEEHKKRYFTPYGKWLLREYNELPHQFRNRICLATEYSDDYLKLFISPIYGIISKFIMYLIGVYGMIMLYIFFFEKTLIIEKFYEDIIVSLTFIIPILKFLNYFIDDKIKSNPFLLLKKSSVYTHIYPDNWKRNSDADYVKKELEEIIPTKLKLLILEIKSIIYSPYFLWSILPGYIEDLDIFIGKMTITTETMGSICIYSTLSIEKFGNQEFKDLVMNYEPLWSSKYELEEEDKFYKQDVLLSDKLEKSYITFKTSYKNEIVGVNDVFGDTIIDGIKKIINDKSKFERFEEQYIEEINKDFFDNLEKYKEALLSKRSMNN